MSRDLLERYGKAPVGLTSYRESVVKQALRIRFWTRTGLSVLALGLVGLLYTAVPGVAIGIIVGSLAVGTVYGLTVGSMALSRAYHRSSNIIKFVEKIGVLPDE